MITTICVGVCKIHPEHKICKGCYRSEREIQLWHRVDDDGKQEIIEACDIKRDIYGNINT